MRQSSAILAVLVAATVFAVGAAYAVSGIGGDVTVIGNSTIIHTFTNSGTFTVLQTGNVEVLVVGGGGGAGGGVGGNQYCGGGGGGGVIYYSSFPVTVGPVAVTVGEGGCPGVAADGTSGGDSVFSSLTAEGGGYGGGGNGYLLEYGHAGGNGGSGGGAANGPAGGTGGSGQSGQGYEGGSTVGMGAAAGGGGASAAGTVPNAGAGVMCSISGTPTGYGGGGGGAPNGTAADGGGAGGETVGVAGLPKTGGGGGSAHVIAASAAGGSGVVIVRYTAQVPMVIALPVVPQPVEMNAAGELAEYLQKAVSNAVFPVMAETQVQGRAAIYVGQTVYAASQGVVFTNLGPEQMIERTVGNNLILAGGWPRGTLYAVYDFLEQRIGVHWLAEDTEVVPTMATWVLPNIDINKTPTFGGRSLSTCQSLYQTYSVAGGSQPMWDAESAFLARNRANGCLFDGRTSWGLRDTNLEQRLGWDDRYGWPGGGHTFAAYLYQTDIDPNAQPPASYYTTHPEYFSYSLAWGMRLPAHANIGTQLCMTNADVRNIVLNKLRAAIVADRAQAASEGRPYPVVYSVSQNDGAGYCECDGCRAIATAQGSQSGPLLDFVSWVATNIAAEYPDVVIETFAYGWSRKPPATLLLPPNVQIRICDSEPTGSGEFLHPIDHAYNASLTNDLAAWSSKANRLSFWDYWVIEAGIARPDIATPYSHVWGIQPRLAFLHQCEVKAFFAQDETPELQSFYELQRWLGFQLMQDPTDDANQTRTKALVTTFMEGYYGTGAATDMRSYLDYLEGRVTNAPERLVVTPVFNRSYLDLPFFVNCEAILDQAETHCNGNPDHLRHVRRERIVVDEALLHLWWRLQFALPVGQALPFDRAAVISRLKDYRDEQMLTFRSDLARHADAFTGRLDYRRGVDETMIESNGFRVLPLPLPQATDRAWYGKPVSELFDLAWPHLCNPALLALVTNDNVAVDGYAYRWTGSPADHPFLGYGVYIPGGGSFGGSIPNEPIPQDEQYHWYPAGRCTLTNGAYAWAGNWQLQCSLQRAYFEADTNRDRNVYMSIKVEGPEYVSGSSKPDSVSIDRIMLVKSRGYLPRKDGAIPGNGLKLHLCASSGLTFNGNTLTWTDLSANHRDVSNDVAITRLTNSPPTSGLVTNAINGKAALRFPGDNVNSAVRLGQGDVQYSPSDFGMYNSDYEIVVVARTLTTNDWQTLFAGGPLDHMLRVNPAVDCAWPGGAVFSPIMRNPYQMASVGTYAAYVGNGPHIFSASVENGVAILRVDGQDGMVRIPNARDTNNIPGLYLGFDRQNGTSPFQGDIAEVLIYDHALSSADRASLEAYLNVTYGVIAGPSATLTSPTNGEVFASAPATIALLATAEASAQAEATVTNVAFYSGATRLGSDSTLPYAWTWSGVAAGLYSLTAVAYDTDGGCATSLSRAIVVNDVPSNTLSAPANGAAYLRPAITGIVLTDTVFNTVGGITNVSFYTNGALLITGKWASASTYTNGWSNPPAGRYAVSARVWDSYGANGTSLTNTILVWTNQDIGVVGKAGSATYTNPTYRVMGAGADIETNRDAFRFVYLPMPGSNYTVTARVATMSNPNAWAKTGVMIRKSMATNAVNALVAVTPTTANGVQWQYRASDGGNTTHANTTGITTPRWVKLVRSGNAFSAYQSVTNTSWTQIGTAVSLPNMGTNTVVGLAVTSHTTSMVCTSTFDNVSITVP